MLILLSVSLCTFMFCVFLCVIFVYMSIFLCIRLSDSNKTNEWVNEVRKEFVGSTKNTVREEIWCPLWQPAVNVGTGFSHVSLLPSLVAASAWSMPVWGCHQNPDPGFHQYLAGLLQFVVLRHRRWCDEPPAVSSECSGTSHHGSQAVQAYHASSTSVVLAASPQTSGIQDTHPRLSFVGWHCSCVPSWWMYAGHRRWPLSFAVCGQSNMRRRAITQPVQWLLFCHRQSNTVEQSAWTASATGHHLWKFKQSLKTFTFG